LTAIWGRCTLLEALGRKKELLAAATGLRSGLDERKWPPTRASYEAFAADAERWTGIKRPREIELLTEAVNTLESMRRAENDPVEGRLLVGVGGVPITLIWRRTRDRLMVFAATPAYLEREWLPRAGGGVWLRDDAGVDLTKPRGGGPAMRYAGQTRLPWTVAAATPPRAPEFATRSRLLLLLLAAVGIFSATGGYFVLRALLKEFALARMQEDFVAAVSHEFRTPLSAIRQISESLEDGRVAGEEHRSAYYRSLSRATQRLHRLVEDLLDFRRMQSGAAEYRKRPLDVNDLVRDVAAAFQHEVDEQGFRIAVKYCGGAHAVADGEALGRALWNLLDNAVKYSGANREIEVSVELVRGTVALSVRDRGIGILPEEQAKVFGRFYRGQKARVAGIRGTGIGLAMVKQIAEAHGGRVSVSSEPDAGSTFTLTVPGEENGWRES
jgi:signal transduction histidine kinase